MNAAAASVTISAVSDPSTTAPLDIEQPRQLLTYLRSAGHIGPAEQPVIRTLSGGVSNRTVWVERPNGQQWVLKQALAKLRVQVDWFSDPARIHREALGLRWLEKLTPPGSITPLVFEDHQHHLLAMAAVPPPHDNWKTLLLKGRLDLDHVEQFALLLAAIHRRGGEDPQVARAFDDRSFFESLRLEPYYRYAADQTPQARDFLHELITRTRSRRLTLVHGDYSPKNILIHHQRLVLLDHEVIHFGDPAFDLGFSLTHLLSKAHHLPEHRPAFTGGAKRCWNVYCRNLGPVTWKRDLEEHAVRHILGCLLARVAGRSPLEYLDQEERNRQRAVVVELMRSVPACVEDLIDQFVERLHHHVHP